MHHSPPVIPVPLKEDNDVTRAGKTFCLIFAVCLGSFLAYILVRWIVGLGMEAAGHVRRKRAGWLPVPQFEADDLEWEDLDLLELELFPPSAPVVPSQQDADDDESHLDTLTDRDEDERAHLLWEWTGKEEG